MSYINQKPITSTLNIQCHRITRLISILDLAAFERLQACKQNPPMDKDLFWTIDEEIKYYQMRLGSPPLGATKPWMLPSADIDKVVGEVEELKYIDTLKIKRKRVKLDVFEINMTKQ